MRRPVVNPHQSWYQCRSSSGPVEDQIFLVFSWFADDLSHAAAPRNPLRDDGATVYHRWTLTFAAARSYLAGFRGGPPRDH